MSSEIPPNFDQSGAMKAELANTMRRTSAAPDGAATAEAAADGRDAADESAEDKSVRARNAFAAEVAAMGARLAAQLYDGGAAHVGGAAAGPYGGISDSVASYQETIADLFGFKVR